MWKIFRRLQKENKIAAERIFKIPIFGKASQWESLFCLMFYSFAIRGIFTLWYIGELLQIPSEARTCVNALA